MRSVLLASCCGGVRAEQGGAWRPILGPIWNLPPEGHGRQSSSFPPGAMRGDREPRPRMSGHLACTHRSYRWARRRAGRTPGELWGRSVP
eukprot:9032941-Pyramimonas_sp.AAC.1